MPPRNRRPEDPATSDPEAEAPEAEVVDPDALPPDLDDGFDDEDDEDDAGVALDEDENAHVYVVTVDLVSLKIGPRTNQTLRARRGQLIKIRPDHPYIDVEHLVALKALAPNDGDPKARTTAKALAAAAGAADDPVKTPVSTEVQDHTVVPPEDRTVQTG